MRASDLLEYLTPTQRARYNHVQIRDDRRAATDHFFGVGNDMVREDLPTEYLPGEMSISQDKSNAHQQIERELGYEISVADYVRGIVKDRYNRDVKIGRLLKDEKLRNQFANDPMRQGTRKSGYYATIHRGTEVAGQTNSTPDETHPQGHSWGGQSCKNVDTGGNRHYLEHEIRAGTVVVFIHEPSGKEIYRATLHPYINNIGEIKYALDAVYGVSNTKFRNYAHDVADRLTILSDQGNPVFTKDPTVYNDNGRRTEIHNPRLTPDLRYFMNNYFTNRAELIHKLANDQQFADSVFVSLSTIHRLLGSDLDQIPVLVDFINSNYVSADTATQILRNYSCLGAKVAFYSPLVSKEARLDFLSNSTHDLVRPGLVTTQRDVLTTLAQDIEVTEKLIMRLFTYDMANALIMLLYAPMSDDMKIFMWHRARYENKTDLMHFMVAFKFLPDTPEVFGMLLNSMNSTYISQSLNMPIATPQLFNDIFSEMSAKTQKEFLRLITNYQLSHKNIWFSEENAKLILSLMNTGEIRIKALQYFPNIVLYDPSILEKYMRGDHSDKLIDVLVTMDMSSTIKNQIVNEILHSIEHTDQYILTLIREISGNSEWNEYLVYIRRYLFKTINEPSATKYQIDTYLYILRYMFSRLSDLQQMKDFIEEYRMELLGGDFSSAIASDIATTLHVVEDHMRRRAS